MRWVSRLLFGLAGLAMVGGMLAGVMNREVLDGDRFAAHVDHVRADADVSRELGTMLSEQLIDANPELVALRPLVESASQAAVSSRAFGPIIRSTVAPLHRALVADETDQVVLRIADLAAVVATAVTTLSPETKAYVPDDLTVALSAFGSQEASAGLVSAAQRTDRAAWLLPLLAAILTALGAWARARAALTVRDVTASFGRVLIGAALALAVLIVVAGYVLGLADTSTLSGAIASAAWAELTGPLWRTALLVGVCGVALWLTQHAARVPSRAEVIESARSFVTERPTSARALALRGGSLIAAGVVLALHPLTVVTAVVVVAAVVLAIAGLEDLMAASRQARASSSRRISWPRIPTRSLVTAVVAALLAGGLTLAVWPASDRLPPAVAASSTSACNGHDELCNRPFNEVAFAATHNSMSAADEPGWFLAEQPTGLVNQLRRGIRGLLFDTWYGQQTGRNNVIATAARSRDAALAEARDAYGQQVVDSALRLRESLNLTGTGPVKPYLCHGMCELGASDMAEQMQDIADWMRANPREVVTFVIQDEVTPDDTAAVLREAGLADMAHTQNPAEPWPTLGDMIASGERLVVIMENRAGGAKNPWIHNGDDFVQDTPYHFTSARSFTSAQGFSCEQFRGAKTAPLFLINHWLSNYQSRVADAAKVNAVDVLLPRVTACQEQRGMTPNLVAVNNFDQGDVLAVVNEINGVR